MFFNERSNLCFAMHKKQHFEMKYLNEGSCHPRACKKAIPQGVAIFITGLTTKIEETRGGSLLTHYPGVHKALVDVGLLKGGTKLPNLGGILSKIMGE